MGCLWRDTKKQATKTIHYVACKYYIFRRDIGGQRKTQIKMENPFPEDENHDPFRY